MPAILSDAPISSTEPIAAVRIFNISEHGYWIDLGNEKLYVTYADFPCFAGATLAQLDDVRQPSADHLHWPALEIDLSLASLRDPAASATANARAKATDGAVVSATAGASVSTSVSASADTPPSSP